MLKAWRSLHIGGRLTLIAVTTTVSLIATTFTLSLVLPTAVSGVVSFLLGMVIGGAGAMLGMHEYYETE